MLLANLVRLRMLDFVSVTVFNILLVFLPTKVDPKFHDWSSTTQGTYLVLTSFTCNMQ